jgi:hypothetical protein
MKTGFSKSFFWLVVPSTLAIAGLIAAHSPSNSDAQAATSASATTSTAASETAFSPQPSTENSSAQNTLPSNILPTSPLAEVIKLSKAGVNENVIMTYVTNSGGTFNLDSDKIIYLADTGVANGVVSAMMQHDQQLQQQMAAAPATQPDSTPAPNPNYTSDAAPQPEPEQVTVNYFNSSLAPYGNWVEVPGYGRCWRPTATYYDSSWQPYCDRGHWVYTDCGWYWNSDYSWGTTFHYGRWFRDTHFGWCWWPHTVWAPSWVTWRYANDFCGWAPLPPFAVCQPGIGFVYQGNGVSVGFDFGLSPACYTFVPTANFCDARLRNHCFAPAQVTRIFNHTTVINNININNHTVFNHGLTVQQISAAIGTPIRQMSAHDLRTTLHEVRTGTFNRQNRSSNDSQNPSAFGTARNEQPQVPVVTARDPQERSRSIPGAQQHFAPGERFSSTAPVENSDASPRTTSGHPQQFDQNRTRIRNNVEAPRYMNVREQNPVVAPMVNRPAPTASLERNFNQSRSETVADARPDHSEPAAAVQSRPQPAQAPVASQPDKSGKQDKGQNWPR